MNYRTRFILESREYEPDILERDPEKDVIRHDDGTTSPRPTMGITVHAGYFCDDDNP